MKRIIFLLMAAGLALGASAQKQVIRGNFRPHVSHGGSKVIVVAPYRSFYPSYYGYQPWGYPFGFDPFYGYGRYRAEPSGLDLQIEKIRNDYSHEISSVRHDESLGKTERKQRIRDLKHERENAIIDVKQDYYKEKTNS